MPDQSSPNQTTTNQTLPNQSVSSQNASNLTSTNLTDELNDEIEKLIDSLKSVQLATLNQLKKPEISYTPFLRYPASSRDQFYIFISELASHTQNLHMNAGLSLMFIEDEKSCKNVFARKRLILECHSQRIERESELWTKILNEFELRQGKTIALLKTLPDFHLFKLNASKGNYVKGFGQAFSLCY